MPRIIVNIIYFKPSGKYYTGCGDVDLGEIPVHRIPEIIRHMVQEKTLPGLASGSWDGPILAVMKDCELPFLILPGAAV